MRKPATPEEENNPPPGFRVQYEKDPIAGTVGYLVPDDSGMDGGMSVSPALPPASGPRMSAAGGRKPYDLSMSLRAPEYTDAVAAMKATAGRSMPRFPVDEGDDLEEEDVGQGPMVQPTPASRPAPAAPQPQPSQGLAIPPDLLERLRAARRRDAADARSSSLGRLLMATSAGFSGVPTAPALMQDYMAIEKERRGAGRREFGEEQAVLEKEAETKKAETEASAKAEEAARKRREDAYLDDPTTPTARFYQRIARDRLGIPEPDASRLTERVAKGLLDVFKTDEGTKRALEVQASKVEAAERMQNMKEQLARWQELSRSGDRAQQRQMQLMIAAWKASQDGRTNVERERLANQREKQALDRVTSLEKQLPKDLENSVANILEIERIAVNPKTGKFKSSIPGVGFLVGAVPDRAVGLIDGPEASALRKAYNSLKNDYAHARYGGALQKNEERRMDKALADIEGANTASEFILGFKELRSLVYNSMNRIYRGYDDDTVAEHFRRGGIMVPGDKRHGPGGVIDKKLGAKPEAEAPAAGLLSQDEEAELKALESMYGVK